MQSNAHSAQLLGRSSVVPMRRIVERSHPGDSDLERMRGLSDAHTHRPGAGGREMIGGWQAACRSIALE